MKLNRFAPFVFIAAAICGACGSGTKQAASNSGPGNSPLCKSPCVGVAYLKRIQPGDAGWNKLDLQPDEANSLKQTMQTAQAAGPADKYHVHADAVNGRLAFSAEANPDPAHVSGAEPQVSIGAEGPQTSSPAVRLVATPAAAKILQERSRQP